jgi:hypothetical protein
MVFEPMTDPDARFFSEGVLLSSDSTGASAADEGAGCAE